MPNGPSLVPANRDLKIPPADVYAGGGPAPNYRPADRPGENCASCKYFRSSNRLCAKYGFKADKEAVCDGFERISLEKLNAFRSKKAQRGAGATPNTPIAPMQPPPAMQHNSAWQGHRMVGTQEAMQRPGPHAGVAAMRQKFLGNVGAPPPQAQQQRNDVPPSMNQAQQAAKTQAQGIPQKSGAHTMPAKRAAVHLSGTPKPKDWMHKVNKPSKENGGIPTYGDEAWSSTENYLKSLPVPIEKSSGILLSIAFGRMASERLEKRAIEETARPESQLSPEQLETIADIRSRVGRLSDPNIQGATVGGAILGGTGGATLSRFQGVPRARWTIPIGMILGGLGGYGMAQRTADLRARRKLTGTRFLRTPPTWEQIESGQVPLKGVPKSAPPSGQTATMLSEGDLEKASEKRARGRNCGTRKSKTTKKIKVGVSGASTGIHTKKAEGGISPPVTNVSDQDVGVGAATGAGLGGVVGGASGLAMSQRAQAQAMKNLRGRALREAQRSGGFGGRAAMLKALPLTILGLLAGGAAGGKVDETIRRPIQDISGSMRP